MKPTKDVTTDPKTTWNSGDPSVATMDRFGIATGIKTGVSNIWVTYNLVNYPFTTLTVNPVMTITVAPNPATANVGDIVTFTAMGKYDDPSLPPKDLTNLAMWNSNNNTIASFGGSFPNTNNQASVNNPGTATITATWSTPYGQTAVGTAILNVLGGMCRNYTHYRQNVGSWKDDPFAMNWDANPVRPRNQQDLDNALPNAKLTAPEFGGTANSIYRLSIAGKGCNMTSAAMVLTAATGTLITPGQLNQNLQTHDGYTDQNEPDWVVIKSLYPAAKIDYVDYNTNIDILLQNCDMVIIKLGASGPTQSTISAPIHPFNHFVLAVKKENGKYKIYDPWLMRDNNGNILDNPIQLDDLDDPVRQLLRGGYSYKGIKLKKI